MKPLSATNYSSILLQRIEEEQLHYEKALKNNQPSGVLKKINQAIELLKAQLNGTLPASKRSHTYHPALTER